MARVALLDDVHLVGVRPQDTDDDCAVRLRVRAEHRVRVVVGAREHLVDSGRVRGAGVGRRLVDRLDRVLRAIHR